MKFSCVKHVNCSKSAGFFFVLFAALLCYHRLLLFDFTLFSKAIEMRAVQYYVTFFGMLFFLFHSVRFPMNQSILNYFILNKF